MSPETLPITLAAAQRAMVADLKRSGLTPRDIDVEAVIADYYDQPCLAYKITYNGSGFDRLRYLYRPARKGFEALRKPRKPPGKYSQRKGSPVLPYFPKQVDWPTVKQDPAVALVKVEGEKKSVAVAKLGVPAVGLGGVWNFKDKLCDLLPAFNDFAWAERTVYLIYDSDAATNPDVTRAANAHARALNRRGAHVRIIIAPELESGVKCGIDDFLVAKGGEARAALGELLQAATPWDPRLGRRLLCNEKGAPLPLLANAITLLMTCDEWVGTLRFNQFACVEEFAARPPIDNAKPGDRLLDDHFTRTADWLQQQGVRVGKHVAADALLAVARANPYHPVCDYLDGLHWDGVPRLDNLLPQYFGAEDGELNRTLGAKFLVAGVARVRQPGCKVDCVLVLIADQGTYKSSGLRLLAVQDDWFVDHIGDVTNKDARLQLQGIWLLEDAEFRTRRYNQESVKGFYTTQYDKFRPPYGRAVVNYPRQCILAASTNIETPLTDETGNRRYWPVRVKEVDLAALKRDRDQLWAEAQARYDAGEPWHLDKRMERLAAAAQDSAREPGVWEERIAAWLENPTNRYSVKGNQDTPLRSTRDRVDADEVLVHCLGLEPGKWTSQAKRAVWASLRALGYKSQTVRDQEDYRKVERWWVRTGALIKELQALAPPDTEVEERRKKKRIVN
jgi:hypothetical protein